MKRLLRISLDLCLLSSTSVVVWILLAMIIDNNLINIFSLTYPVQFIHAIIIAIFSVGANLSKEKDKAKDAVMSGMSVGITLGTIIFGLLAIFASSYIRFMKLSIETYKVFTIYFFLASIVTLIFIFILNKLYYEEKNKLANKYSIIFNALWIISLILPTMITKNQVLISTISLCVIGVYTAFICIKSWDKFKFSLNVKNCIKYNSVEICNNFAYFLIFLFGYRTTFEYGAEYTNALTFISLITDAQSDAFGSIVTAAQIDISKNKFNYRNHKNNAYKLLLIFLITMILMFVLLFNNYDLNLVITLTYFIIHIITFSIYPGYRIKMCYLQLEWSAFKTTINKLSTQIIRFMFSFIKSPFCTALGQLTAGIYQAITINYMFYKHYIVRKDGIIEKINNQKVNINDNIDNINK